MKQWIEFLRGLVEASRRDIGMGATQRFLLLSIIIGIFSGLLVVCFHIAIEFVGWFTIHTPAGAGVWTLLLSPAIGAGWPRC